MLTVANIRNSKMKSGYNHVGFHPGNGVKPDRYHAQKNGATGPGLGAGWMGPDRKTALAAAEDYCAYVNGTFLLTPDDIKNPKVKSGHNHVEVRPVEDGRKNRFRANVYGGTLDAAGRSWQGPRRATALEAAQDYCDYVNQKAGRMPVKLKSAGHVGAPRKSVTEDPKVAEARALLREASTDNDPSGYVYCIAEVTSLDAVKIGKSKDHPRHRLAGLQTGNKRPLYVASYIETADRNALERKLHAQFIDHNELGEWFTTTDEILEVFGLTAKAESKAA